MNYPKNGDSPQKDAAIIYTIIHKGVEEKQDLGLCAKLPTG